MVNRPGDFDTTTPTGSHSPRQGDDEIRKVKTFTQNAFNDMTQAEGANLERHALFGTMITSTEGFTGDLTGDSTGAHNGVVGSITPDVATFTEATADEFIGLLTGNVTGDLKGNVFNEDDTAILSVGSNEVDAIFDGNVIGNVTGNVSGSLTGNVTGDVTGNLTGDILDSEGDVILATGDELETPIFNGNVLGGLSGDVLGNVTGNVTGDVTGNVTGDLTGAVTGNVTGDVTGNVTGDLTGDVTGALTGNVTGDLTGNVTGNITGNAGGNAATATQWASPINIAIGQDGGGDITGTISIDGSGNVSPNLNLRAGATQGTSVASAARWTDAVDFSFGGVLTGTTTGVDGSGNVTLTASYASGAIADLNGVTQSDSLFLVSNGNNWVGESGATARSSLGLGSAATTNSNAYATAAQGLLAASALQSVPSSYDTRTVADGRYATSAQGDLAATALQSVPSTYQTTIAADNKYATASQGTLAASAVQPSEALNTGTGTLTINGWVFSIAGSGSTQKIVVSRAGVNLFSVNASGDAVFSGNVTANGTP